MKLEIDYSKDNLLTDFSKKTLQDRYLVGDEQSPQEAFARAASAFADDQDHAQRIYDYASNLWFMFATPVLSNGGTQRGLPISCFLNYVDDSREGITGHYTENAYLSSMGGGIGGGVSNKTTKERAMQRIKSVSAAIDSNIFLPAAEGSWACGEKYCGYWNMCDFGAKRK